MHLTDQLLSRIFADSSRFCGKEDVIHAIIHYQLTKAGISPLRIAREQMLAGKRADVVLFGEDVRGNFSKTLSKPLVVIEVKGAAYGNRNALSDVIDETGYCKDMGKLKGDAVRGIECWFLCVDMPELGRALSLVKLKLVSEQCTAHGLCLAYHCQHEPHFYVSHPNSQLIKIPVPGSDKSRKDASLDFLFAVKDAKFNAFAHDSLALSGNEANITSLLYNSLRDAGFGVNQLSLETYFSFAAENGRRMQERPDLVIFDADFDGRFNLYQGGDPHRSNDGHKLDHIYTIFEIKGGAAIDKKSEKAIMDDYLEDIIKLCRWRDRAAAVRPGTNVQVVFIGIDGRSKSLSRPSLDLMIAKSRNLGVGIIYIGRTATEVRRGS